MSNGDKKPKDAWDKTDVIGKLLTGVVLGLLTLAIKVGADKIQQGSEKIATSQKKGQLVQSLLSDLSKPEEGMRQDIAMIALDKSIGEDDPTLVLDIAEQIVRHRPKEQNGQIASIVAFRILERRDKSRAENIKKDILGSISDTPEHRDKLISNADASVQAEKPRALDAGLISNVFPTIVYVQFQGDIKRPLLEELRKSLNEQGLPAPGVQRVPGNYVSSVRYFNEEDQEQAKSLALKAKQFFESKSCPVEFKLQDLSSAKFKPPKGQFEIWINLNCNK